MIPVLDVTIPDLNVDWRASGMVIGGADSPRVSLTSGATLNLEGRPLYVGSSDGPGTLDIEGGASLRGGAGVYVGVDDTGSLTVEPGRPSPPVSSAVSGFDPAQAERSRSKMHGGAMEHLINPGLSPPALVVAPSRVRLYGHPHGETRATGEHAGEKGDMIIRRHHTTA
jgi:hypothetical protein